MYRIALCDDDMVFAAQFKQQLQAFFKNYMIVYEFTSFNSVELLMKADEKQPFDIMFLDILMDGENGIEFAKKLRSKNRNVNIIFVSSCRDYAIDSFDVLPLYYLLKPIDPDKLKTALLRALSTRNYTVSFTTPHNTLVLDTDKVYYIEVFNHTIVIHKTDGTIEKINGNLCDLEDKFPPLVFARIHRSYLVNIKYIEGIHHYYVQLPDNIELPIARNRFSEIQTMLLDRMQKKSLFL